MELCRGVSGRLVELAGWVMTYEWTNGLNRCKAVSVVAVIGAMDWE